MSVLNTFIINISRILYTVVNMNMYALIISSLGDNTQHRKGRLSFSDINDPSRNWKRNFGPKQTHRLRLRGCRVQVRLGQW